MRQSRKIIKLVVGFWGAFAAIQICGGTLATAADKLVVRFGAFSESMTLAELRAIAETGKFPDGYEIYTKRLSPQQRTQVISALRTNMPVSVVTVNNLLSTRIGTTILRDLTTVIKREDTAGLQALRAGLVLGSTTPQGLSVLSFIAAYPSKQLEIDLKQAFQVAGTFNIAFWQTQRFMEAIAPRLSSRKTDLKLPFDPSQPGSGQVQVMKFTLDDQKRQRILPVDLYWSNILTPDKPVIILSHGLGSVRTEIKYLAEHLASHGYAVVAFEHPGSNQANLNAALAGKNRIMKPQEFLERPQDISFILDQLAAKNRSSNFPLAGKLANNNVMVLGYSFGGSTALALGGAEYQLERLKQRCKENISVLSLGEGMQCIAQELPENNYQLRDIRVKQIIAFSPSTSLLFGDTGLSKIEIPTLMLAASADKTTPALTEQIVGFDQMRSPKWLVGIMGATHLSVKDPSATMDQRGKIDTPISGGEVVGEEAVDIRNYVKGITLAFAAQLTPEAKSYQVFLTPDYAQYASTTAFPICLVTQIPPDAMNIVKEFTQK
ncbi:MAG: alpha/beta hydrolase [Methylacidiphilales bacterium]|nr:alpha/beta hydrolase [Candidatus Methylacidiphilales bacterium]NJR17776.1 alpha/beta hydrolase [Calothrix sp. CSU_2_0]